MLQPFRIVESKTVLEPTPPIGGWQTLTPADARGYVWIFEEPRPNATYVLGCDPAQGVVGWDRTIPQDDQDHDNSAISVWRVGKREVLMRDPKTSALILDKAGKPRTMEVDCDYQVAEYAAPIDYGETARVVNALGRMFRGNNHLGCCHAIIEVWPGPGWMVEKTLISEYGYLNFYQRKMINTLEPMASKGIGWEANLRTVRDLWLQGTRHLIHRKAVIRSPWLLNEMKTTEPIKFMEYRSESQSGFHDDRLRAAMLSFHAAHDFSGQFRSQVTTTVENNSKPVNWQASDLSADSLKDEWQRKFEELGR